MATITATILDFPERAATGTIGPKERTSGSADQPTAQIIIFPGVRIERWEEPQDKPIAGRKKRAAAVSRDTLDLLD